MKGTIPMLMLFIGAVAAPRIVLSQEEGPIMVEESAEVSLEEYSDAFQESFFEGLKQQGIQNYDKAINAFLKCKDLEPEKEVVSFELAKSYLLDKQYINAEQYAREAVSEDPSNYWYAHTLAETLEAQKASVSMIKNQIPWANTDFKKNLSESYFELGNYQEASLILDELELTPKMAYLKSKIKDSIAKKEDENNMSIGINIQKESSDASDLVSYQKAITDMLNGSTSADSLLEVTEEALESYPAQPFFHYAYGYALNREQKSKEAIEALETALDYLINDGELENSIYKELAKCYSALGNTEKANLYSSKVKPGF